MMGRDKIKLCVVCKYPLRGLAVRCRCPECGTPYDESSVVWYGRVPLVADRVLGDVTALASVVLIVFFAFPGNYFLISCVFLAALVYVGYRVVVWWRAHAIQRQHFIYASESGILIGRLPHQPRTDLTWPEFRSRFGRPEHALTGYTQVLPTLGIKLPPRDARQCVEYLLQRAEEVCGTAKGDGDQDT